jgi:hypothetical protein
MDGLGMGRLGGAALPQAAKIWFHCPEINGVRGRS